MKKQIVLASLIFVFLLGIAVMGVVWFEKQKNEIQKEQLTHFGEEIEVSGLSWSPDGQKIAFSRKDKIWIMDSDGSNQKQLLAGKDNVWSPNWSPDGNKIIYVSHKFADLNDWTATPYEIWIINSDGSEPKKLTESMRGIRNLSWSPDGNKIIYIATAVEMLYPEIYDPQEELWIMNSDGTNQNVLINIKKTVESVKKANWGPDGKDIIANFYIDGKYGLLAIASDGSGNEKVIAPELDIWDFSLSRDGKKIAFAQIGEIWIMDNNGNKRKRLATDINDTSNLSWSPDEQKIAFIQNGEIWTIRIQNL